MLKNGQAFHLARSKGGHAALGIAAARGQHLVAECFQLAVNAADVGDGGVAQIGRQAREGGVLLIGLRRDAIGGVAQKRRLGQLGDDVGLSGVPLAGQQVGRINQQRPRARRAVQGADPDVPDELLFADEPRGKVAAVPVGFEAGLALTLFTDDGDQLRNGELAPRAGLAGKVAVVGVQCLVAGIEEVLADRLSEAELDEAGVQRVDDGAHDGAVVHGPLTSSMRFCRHQAGRMSNRAVRELSVPRPS